MRIIVKKAFFLSFISFPFFHSCRDAEISEKEINEFVKKYDSVEFNELKNIFIHQRSTLANEEVYVVNKFNSNLPVYFVTYNIRKGVIKEIDNSLLRKDSIPDYFTDVEIKNAIQILRKYNFFLLGVDSFCNVFINPYKHNEPPFLMRLQKQTGEKTVRNGYSYHLFKNRWYVRK